MHSHAAQLIAHVSSISLASIFVDKTVISSRLSSGPTEHSRSRAFQCPFKSKRLPRRGGAASCPFFCSQAVGSCNLVLLVHLLRWKMPILQATQVKQVTIVKQHCGLLIGSWSTNNKEHTRARPARNPGTPPPGARRHGKKHHQQQETTRSKARCIQLPTSVSRRDT